MIIRSLIIAAFCLVTVGTVFAQKTNVDWDRNANFSNYRTYAWQKSPNPAKGLWDQRILDGIEQQLTAKGLTKTDSNPDLTVVYSNSLSSQKQVVGTGYNMGPAWHWGWGGGPGFNTVEYNTYITKQGTLVVELADARNQQLVWRGSASAVISDNSDKNIKTLGNALNKLFKNYPPQDKK